MAEIEALDGTRILVDPEDRRLLSMHRWHCHNGYYMTRTQAGRQGKIWLHHLVMGRCPERGMQATFINSNPTDVRKDNLAWVLRGIVSHRLSRKKRGRNPSMYRGVAWDGESNRWAVRLTVDGETHIRRGFAEEVEAALAYDRLAEKHLGPWAILNFPPEERIPPPGIGRSAERHRLETEAGDVMEVDAWAHPVVSRHDWTLVDGTPWASIGNSRVPLGAIVLDATYHLDHRLVHQNGNPLDYRTENLEWFRPPCLKRHLAGGLRRGFRWVIARPSGRFQAAIKAQGKSRHLGMFLTAEDAAREGDKEAKKLYGRNAILNFPENPDA